MPNRRNFLSTAVASLGAGALLRPDISNAEENKPGFFTIPKEEVKLTQDADVIVCGAGPAGISAAICAARAGAKVRLFEWRGCLGGIWTAGLLGYFLDFDKPGFAKELRLKLDERDARAKTEGFKAFSYDPEALKLLLEELCLEANIKFQLHTRVSAAFRNGKQLTTIITDSKAGRQAWSAPVFIDTTGDGDLAALAGCSFALGDPQYGNSVEEGCPCQPMSLNALLLVKDPQALREFIRFGTKLPGENTNDQKKNRIREAIESTGHFPSYSKPTLWHVKENLIFAMFNHEYGVKPFDPVAVTEATVNARAEMHKMIDGLRNLGGPWEGIQIVATAEQIGVRDGRRVAGRYTVSKEDLIKGARHEDAVTRATFGVDIHATTANHNKASATHATGIKVKPYDIPLRALLAKDVDGLLLAGRCISGDFISHSSYRVTGNAVGMGEAAGIVAAIAAKSGRNPHEVRWEELSEIRGKLFA